MEACLTSLAKLDYPKDKYEVIMVDEGSTDGSVEYVKNNFPWIRIIRANSRLGFPRGNNLGISQAHGEYVVLLNNDTEVDRDWLGELVKVAESDAKIGVCTSKLLMFTDRSIINSAGGEVHYLGFSWPRAVGTRNGGLFEQVEETPLASGCSLLIRRSVIEEIGELDDSYHLYVDDVDYTWRVRLAGYKALYVPTSVVYHKYAATVKQELSENKKFYFLERNRLATLMKNYSAKSILILLPMLLIVELGLLLYFLRSGKSAWKIRGYLWIARNLKNILVKRKLVQRFIRKRDDKSIMSIFTPRFAYFTVGMPMVGMINRALTSYWRLARALL